MASVNLATRPLSGRGWLVRSGTRGCYCSGNEPAALAGAGAADMSGLHSRKPAESLANTTYGKWWRRPAAVRARSTRHYAGTNGKESPWWRRARPGRASVVVAASVMRLVHFERRSGICRGARSAHAHRGADVRAPMRPWRGTVGPYCPIRRLHHRLGRPKRVRSPKALRPRGLCDYLRSCCIPRPAAFHGWRCAARRCRC